MRHLLVVAGLLILATGVAASAQDVPDLKGAWIPAPGGAHILDGPTRHSPSGTVPLPGDDTLKRNATKFVFNIDGQDGRTFWGNLESAKVSEKLIGAISVDGKRFIMADEDGVFNGVFVDADTLDYCYAHITSTNRAVACGVLVREK